VNAVLRNRYKAWILGEDKRIKAEKKRLQKQSKKFIEGLLDDLLRDATEAEAEAAAATLTGLNSTKTPD